MSQSTNRRRFLLAVIVGTAGLLLLRSQSTSPVGYAVVQASPGGNVPLGTALFSYTNPDGVLVSQAGVDAGTPTSAGRIFVDESDAKTSIALVNPTPGVAHTMLVLRDSAGNQVQSIPLSLTPGQHVARYVTELFPGIPTGFVGSLSFQSDQPLAALTLCETRNRYDEPVYATLPVVDLTAAQLSGGFIFPQIAVGSGFTTDLILVNRSDQKVTGQIKLTASDGTPLLAEVSGSAATELSYEISPQGAFKAELNGVADVTTGYATITPAAGSSAPAGAAVFKYKIDNQMVTEAGVLQATPTTAARIFVDQNRTRTGLAIANPGTLPATLTLTLTDYLGKQEPPSTIGLDAGTHFSKFVDEIFTGLNDGFTGVLDIRSDVPVASVTLRVTVNSRNEQILTTLPVLDLLKPPTAMAVVFPQIVIGVGFSTRFILLSGDSVTAANGTLGLFSEDGSPWTVPLSGSAASQFPYAVAAGAGRQYLPGNTQQVKEIQVIDQSTNNLLSEISVNEGGTVQPSVRMIDGAGMIRDDFALSINSIDPSIASVNSTNGTIRGNSAGFATLSYLAGSQLTTITATVVHLDSGQNGVGVNGVVQDPSKRLYLAATEDHTVLLSQTLSSIPVVYAGASHSPGSANGQRITAARFRSPSFLAINHYDGTLYIGDSGNNVIRQLGAAGLVQVLAGTGSPGTNDGGILQASFNNPQGIAMDDFGYLWVADTGNHTIRRIDLTRGVVTTIAGRAGSPGLADGTGTDAQFSSPTGIVIEQESAAQQIAREMTGAPPPPPTILVADTGNGVLRRVTLPGADAVKGIVSTISDATPLMSALKTPSSRIAPSPATANLRFASPSAVAVDANGNIYVAERGTGSVRIVLQSGRTTQLTQPGTFTDPRNVAIDENGRILVAESNSSVKEVRFGEPRIDNISPNHTSYKGGERITISGSNFSPDSVVAVLGVLATDAHIENTQRITFTMPGLPESGLATVTVRSRGGISQAPLLAEPNAVTTLLPGYITTVAGGETFVGDGSPATSAPVIAPQGVAIDGVGDTFFVDGDRVRKVSKATGVITTVAGTGETGYNGDGQLAITAQLHTPQGIAVDRAGNLYIADTQNSRLRMVSASTGMISTLAGTGRFSFGGDGGPPQAAVLYAPSDIAVDSAGNIFFSDRDNQRIRSIDPAHSIIRTIAGSGAIGPLQGGFSGDGGPATSARLSSPAGIALDSSGGLFILDAGNNRVRRVDAATGIITSVAGNGQSGHSGDGGPATAASLRLSVNTVPLAGWLNDVAVDSGGNLWIADLDLVRRVDASTQTISTIPGFSYPSGTAVDYGGSVVLSEWTGNTVNRIDTSTSAITTVAGTGPVSALGDGQLAGAARLSGPSGIAVDSAGTLYISDTNNLSVRRVDAVTRIITTIAAGIGSPRHMAVDSSDNLFVIVFQNQSGTIQRIDRRTGIVSIYAGNGQNGSTGDGGPATAAAITPSDLAFDANDNLFILDAHSVRRVDPRNGIITTVAGNGGTVFSGDGGPATRAGLSSPLSIAIDRNSNLFISDGTLNGEEPRIRRVDAATGTITTVGSSPTSLVPSMALDGLGRLYLSNFQTIGRLDFATGVTTTVAGAVSLLQPTGFMSNGDDGPAIQATMNTNYGQIVLDRLGNLYLTDRNRIRVIRGPLP